MNKDLFIHHLEKQAPHLHKKIEEGLYADALRLLEMQPSQEKTRYLNTIISQGIAMMERGEKENASSLFLLLSELPDMPDIQKNFCLDAMLVAEDDFQGEFKSPKQLRKEFEEHIKARQ